jgi:uncharacterized protein (DUF1800 family)
MNRKNFFKTAYSINAEIPSPEKVNLGDDFGSADSQKQIRKRGITSGLSKYGGNWGRSEVLHLLRRTTYGPKISDVKDFEKLTLSEAVAKLMDTSNYSFNPPVNNYQNTNPDANSSYGKTWVNAPLDFNLEPSRKNSVKAWFWSLPLNQSSTLMEKMIVFWHNHLPVQMLDIPVSASCYTYAKVLNDYALGNFKSLIQQITVDPAMLYYLNGRLNTKKAPDENYARELQELFTLGKGTASQYSEEDVKQAARVLTGFTINPTTSPFSTSFVSANHETGDKTFSSFYGNTVIKGRTGVTAGMDELKDLLNMIFAVEEVSKFICRRLYKYFVYYEIDSVIETNVIEPLAKVFRDNGYEIKPVLKTLFESEHFYDSWNRGAMIKDPLSHTVGYLRQWEVQFPNATDYQKLYKFYSFGSAYTAILQMNLGDPPSVSGWEAWYQVPLFHRTWITSDSLPKRNEFQDYLMWIGHAVDGFKLMVDPWILTKQFSEPRTPDKLIAEAIQFLLPQPLDSSQIASLKSILLPGGIPDYNWSDEYDAATNTSYPNHAAALSTATTKLKLLYKSLMNLSEYQLS